MTETYFIGLDLGGTNIQAALVDHTGKMLGTHSIATEASKGVDHVLDNLHQAARTLCADCSVRMKDVLGVGVGSPGPLDLKRGVVMRASNLPGWVDVPLRDRLSSLSGKPVGLLNDANAACYGEYRFGSGDRTNHMAMLTLGTGVGGGIIIDGRLVQGSFGNAGELGHMIVIPDGRKCRCGQRGCLEAYAGAWSIKERMVETGAVQGVEHADIPDLLRAVGEGQSAAAAIWDESCHAIALACVNLFHAFNPGQILLGGGVAAAGYMLLEPVRQKVSEMFWNLSDDRPEIDTASLGASAGAMGAAAWMARECSRIDSKLDDADS